MSREIVRCTAGAIRAVQLHGLGHDVAIDAVRDLTQIVNARLSEGDRVAVEIVDGRAHVSGEEIDPRTSGLAQEIEILRGIFGERLVAGIVFEEMLDPDDLRSWIAFFARPVSGEAGARRLHKELDLLAPLGVRLLLERRLEARPRATSSATDSRAALANAFAEALDRVGRGEAVEWARLARAIDELVRAVIRRPDHALSVVSGPRTPGSYATVHAANTALISILLGRMLGIDEPNPSDRRVLVERSVERMQLPYAKLATPEPSTTRLNPQGLHELASCALFADIGFALLPEVTHRAMSPSEKEELRSYMTSAIHPLLRGESVDESSSRRLIVAYEHHRSFLHPGSGRRIDTHPYSRIVAVADAYDAMVTDRPWRPAMSRQAALASLEREKSWRFDPMMVTTLATLLRGDRGMPG